TFDLSQLVDLCRASQLAEAVADEDGSGHLLLKEIARVRQYRRDPGANAVAADHGGMADRNAVHVCDGVARPGRQNAHDQSHIARPWSFLLGHGRVALLKWGTEDQPRRAEHGRKTPAERQHTGDERRADSGGGGYKSAPERGQNDSGRRGCSTPTARCRIPPGADSRLLFQSVFDLLDLTLEVLQFLFEGLN